MTTLFPSDDENNEAAQEAAAKKEWYNKLKSGPVTKNPHIDNINATREKLISLINLHKTIKDFANDATTTGVEPSIIVTPVNDIWYPHRNIINQYQSTIETILVNFNTSASAFIAHTDVQCGVKDPSSNPDANDPAGLSISLAIADAVTNFETELEGKSSKDWQSSLLGCTGPNVALFDEINNNLASLNLRIAELSSVVLANTSASYGIYATKSATVFDNFPAWNLMNSVPASEKSEFTAASKMLNKNLFLNQLVSGNAVISGILK